MSCPVVYYPFEKSISSCEEIPEKCSGSRYYLRQYLEETGLVASHISKSFVMPIVMNRPTRPIAAKPRNSTTLDFTLELLKIQKVHDIVDYQSCHERQGVCCNGILLTENILEQNEGNSPVNDGSKSAYKEVAEELDVGVLRISGEQFSKLLLPEDVLCSCN